ITCICNQQVVYKSMTVPAVNVCCRLRMPAEVVRPLAPGVPAEKYRAVYQRIVVTLNVVAVENTNALVAIDKNVARDNRSLGDFEEKAAVARPEPVAGIALA